MYSALYFNSAMLLKRVPSCTIHDHYLFSLLVLCQTLPSQHQHLKYKDNNLLVLLVGVSSEAKANPHCVVGRSICAIEKFGLRAYWPQGEWGGDE